MEHYQFGFVITFSMDTDQVSTEDAQEWAEAEANKLIQKLEGVEGVQVRVPMLIHPNHVLKLEQTLERL
jgi:hypothetical protein